MKSKTTGTNTIPIPPYKSLFLFICGCVHSLPMVIRFSEKRTGQQYLVYSLPHNNAELYKILKLYLFNKLQKIAAANITNFILDTLGQ